MNGRGVNPSIWVHLGAVGHSSPQLKLSWQAGGGPDGMEGTTARHISGARGRGGLPWYNNVTLGPPSATVCNWSVSQAYLLGCDMGAQGGGQSTWIWVGHRISRPHRAVKSRCVEPRDVLVSVHSLVSLFSSSLAPCAAFSSCSTISREIHCNNSANGFQSVPSGKPGQCRILRVIRATSDYCLPGRGLTLRTTLNDTIGPGEHVNRP